MSTTALTTTNAIAPNIATARTIPKSLVWIPVTIRLPSPRRLKSDSIRTAPENRPPIATPNVVIGAVRALRSTFCGTR